MLHVRAYRRPAVNTGRAPCGCGPPEMIQWVCRWPHAPPPALHDRLLPIRTDGQHAQRSLQRSRHGTLDAAAALCRERPVAVRSRMGFLQLYDRVVYVLTCSLGVRCVWMLLFGPPPVWLTTSEHLLITWIVGYSMEAVYG
eukprot:2047044-Prymnesium_polylepis.1